MIANQKLKDSNGYQIALFPLSGFDVSQADNGTYSHGGGEEYWATDYLGISSNGTRIYRCPCYAPVDLKCIFANKTECMAVWESLEKVHLANGMIDYLTITVYHDNDITTTGITYGTIKRQGEVFNKTGTGGNVTGDHMHLETGYGKYSIPGISTSRGTANYKYHITDYTDPKRLHNYDALFINDTYPTTSPSYYVWKTFSGGIVPTGGYEKKFPWVLYSRKLRNKR